MLPWIWWRLKLLKLYYWCKWILFQSKFAVSKFKYSVECELPNAEIYKFNGYMYVLCLVFEVNKFNFNINSKNAYSYILKLFYDLKNLFH